jgi:hypothetical protein
VYFKRNSGYKGLKLKLVVTRNKTFCAICIPFHTISTCTYLLKTAYTVLLNLATYFNLRAVPQSKIHKSIVTTCCLTIMYIRVYNARFTSGVLWVMTT